jgi:hypothetical protein
VPYVKCPACEQVGYIAAARRTHELCRHCGDLLPLRRTIVPISLHRDDQPEPVPQPAAA